MAEFTPYETGGIAGQDDMARKALLAQLKSQAESVGAGTAPVGVPGLDSGGEAPAEAPAAPPALDFSRMAGYDEGKFTGNKQDAKYQMGRTLAGFDPRKGITPEVLVALNGLGYGEFSGSGQHLSLKGLTDKGRQNKLSGDYDGADFIKGFSGGDGKWQYADPVAEAQEAAQNPQMGGHGAMPPSGLLDKMKGGVNGLDNDFFQKLMAMAQEQAGPPSTDRSALLSLLGGQ